MITKNTDAKEGKNYPDIIKGYIVSRQIYYEIENLRHKELKAILDIFYRFFLTGDYGIIGQEDITANRRIKKQQKGYLIARYRHEYLTDDVIYIYDFNKHTDGFIRVLYVKEMTM